MSEKRLTVRDIVTVAIMIALFFAISIVVGMGTVTMPILYLYGTAGIEMFIGAIFYLVAANRVNKHGLLFIWILIYALITAAMGYAFMVPYFIGLAVICELTMLGKNTYRNPIRNMIGWSTYAIGMFLGIGVPCWIAWESYQKQALASGFADATLKLQYELVSSPLLILVGVVVTVLLSALGILFAQKILKKHFKKAGILD
ncbi:TPA: MptD family putative ECF transporter S component [Streptococcus suis]|uniref:MptD family putative ECF transporter S component n=1 Tax=Bacillota TaxID=1239 RepID=UPI0011462370|nr:MptD family putative ECF transporter S component [Streptococcus suis]MCI7342323.1 MptD family putative ECF transporter S component [Fusobacterium necrophorum]MCK4017938.1 MptD family putative ECF transporter S component [Streptococcus suis]TQE70524.1 MptD family putative ECF transporter S component [Streptococcus suis]HEM4429062.1 MptD family putative ECF transporter S component [Streptococcus suis]